MEWNRNLTPHEVALEKRIAELEAERDALREAMNEAIELIDDLMDFGDIRAVLEAALLEEK